MTAGQAGRPSSYQISRSYRVSPAVVVPYGFNTSRHAVGPVPGFAVFPSQAELVVVMTPAQPLFEFSLRLEHYRL
jgi:hypothetical protein